MGITVLTNVYSKLTKNHLYPSISSCHQCYIKQSFTVKLNKRSKQFLAKKRLQLKFVTVCLLY